MHKLIPALTFILISAPAALSQSQYTENADTKSSQQVVVEAINLSPSHPQTIIDPQAPRAPAQPAVLTGIGPSSNMQQPGDYGYSYVSDLRQLNF